VPDLEENVKCCLSEGVSADQWVVTKTLGKAAISTFRTEDYPAGGGSRNLPTVCEQL
jgi:hypothetical protein